MKLKEQVVSLELARKLKELGTKQESVCYWREIQLDTEFDNQIIWDVDTELSYRSTISNVLQSISAYTVAELGEMMPEACVSVKLSDEWCVYDQDGNLRGCSSTEADARAKMLVYFIENNLMEHGHRI